MAKIYKNAAELVGNTPLLEVGNLEKELGLCFSCCNQRIQSDTYDA